MIHQIPRLEAVDEQVLGLIHAQRQRLRHEVNQNPVRWTGFLRRSTLARAVQGSNSIEGYNADMADAMEIIDDEKPENLAAETLAALTGYRNAMSYILRIHDDPHMEINAQLIRSLHFMMLSYDMTKLPGQWRRGPIFVMREEGGEQMPVYEGPPVEQVPALMDALVQQMRGSEGTDSLVRAALAHLNLAMIHPFRDGNGRMARAVQTLLLTQDGVLSPIFSSIEEWLGRHTPAYYAILARTGQGKWSPQNDALAWVRFCLHAHYQQAETLIRRNNELGRLWEKILAIIAQHDLHERTELALIDAAQGFRVRNAHYRETGGISEAVASRDFRRLCELDLLRPVGEKRGRFYVATDKLKALRNSVREPARPGSVYQIAGAGFDPLRT